MTLDDLLGKLRFASERGPWSTDFTPAECTFLFELLDARPLRSVRVDDDRTSRPVTAATRSDRSGRAKKCMCIPCAANCGRKGNPAHGGDCCSACKGSAGRVHDFECTYDFDDGCKQVPLEPWMEVLAKAEGFRWDPDRKIWHKRMKVEDIGALPFGVRALEVAA